MLEMNAADATASSGATSAATIRSKQDSESGRYHTLYKALGEPVSLCRFRSINPI
jgi:hypothetical protein